jgi:hypothetical protein
MIAAARVPWICGQPCCAGFPPLRYAQSCGWPVDNPLGCPPPTHRPAAAHKLHRPKRLLLKTAEPKPTRPAAAQFANPGPRPKMTLATNPKNR